MEPFHIQKFKVRNFKAFRESSVVDLKPITVFAGVNSSGKSSFLQGLLLLKQSLEHEFFPRLHLTGSPEEAYVEFAQFSEAKFKYASANDKLGFFLQIQGLMPEAAVRFFKGTLPNPTKDAEEDDEKEKSFPLSLYVDIGFRYEEKWGAIVDFLDCRAFCGQATGPHLTINTCPPGTRDDIQFHSMSEDWDEKWVDLMDFQWGTILPPNLMFRPRTQNGTEDSTREIIERIADELGPIMNPLRWLTEELENRFHYLESVRPRPRPLYLIDPSPPLQVSAQGDRPFQWLWYDRQKPVDTIAPGYEVEEKTLIEATNRILKSLGIDQPLSISKAGSSGFQIKFNTIGGEECISISHVGFGISQILPIILICLESKRRDTIIIDHPEIHLHPNAQALLADYFIELMKHNRRIIIETHSQYLINRLVRRTAEYEGLADKINILFTRPPEGEKGATIAPLKLDGDGDISNWPPDFFPEPDEDLAKTLAARIDRGLGK